MAEGRFGDIVSLDGLSAGKGELIASYEQTKVRWLDKFHRVSEYASALSYESVEQDVWFTVPLNAEVNGVLVDEVTDKADLVFHINSTEVLAVRIELYKQCPYSSRARKTENRPQMAPELALMYLGLAPLYEGKTLRVESWYLEGKDDNASNFPPFEHKPGKNIASFTYQSEVMAKEALTIALTYQREKDCSKCRKRAICKISRVACMNESVAEEKETAPVKKAPKFTEAQRSVVEHVDGPMVVVAVPGAGKTTSLVHRLIHLLEAGVSAENILFVTFTKKAAKEIEARVKALLPVDAQVPAIYTFNSFGYTLLRNNPVLLGRRIALATDTDRRGLLWEVLNDGPRNPEFNFSGATLEYGCINRILGWFDVLEEEGLDAFHGAVGNVNADWVLSLHELYTERFKEKGYCTYDEQISLVNELFRRYPSFAEDIANQYRYIMVDEYQDTAEEQAEMIYTIAHHHNNIVVVGDDDQSIYGWRGGNKEFMLKFPDEFKGAKVVMMNDNFRSNTAILEAANAVISGNGERYEKALEGHKEAKNLPTYYMGVDAHRVAEIVAAAGKRMPYGNIAVLARKNSSLFEVEKELEAMGIATTSPKDYLIDDSVFKMYYDIFRLYASLDVDESLYRLFALLGTDLPVPNTKEGSLYERLLADGVLLPMDRLEPDDMDLLEERKDESELYRVQYMILQSFKHIQYSKNFAAMLGEIAEECGVSASHKAVEVLTELADEHAFTKAAEMVYHMEQMVLFNDTMRVGYDPSPDKVNLLTAHDSKGKEFSCVLIYGMEDFSTDEEGNCLVYVAMTRAADTLMMFEGNLGKHYEGREKLKGFVVMKGGVRAA